MDVNFNFFAYEFSSDFWPTLSGFQAIDFLNLVNCYVPPLNPSTTGSPPNNNPGLDAILGLIGGIAAVLVVLAAAFSFRTWKLRQKKRKQLEAFPSLLAEQETEDPKKYLDSKINYFFYVLITISDFEGQHNTKN